MRPGALRTVRRGAPRHNAQLERDPRPRPNRGRGAVGQRSRQGQRARSASTRTPSSPIPPMTCSKYRSSTSVIGTTTAPERARAIDATASRVSSRHAVRSWKSSDCSAAGMTPRNIGPSSSGSNRSAFGSRCTSSSATDVLPTPKAPLIQTTGDSASRATRYFFLSPSRLRTARKASCGTSTPPTCFIRFFPFFCFSRSLRLREMSPP